MSGMFVDASALCAVLLDEPDGDAFKTRLAESVAILTSPLAVFETALAVHSRLGLPFDAARVRIETFLAGARVAVIPITPEIGALAIDARARYGRGTGHPAKLNMGDCFAYACARAHGVALLYKGDDFVHTDLA